MYLAWRLVSFTFIGGASIGIELVDVAPEAGIHLRNISGELEKEWIVEINGNGAAFFDYDEDGDMDVLVTNGSTLGKLEMGGSPVAALYQNLGEGRFADVTEASGIVGRGWAMGVCVADYDNDGAEDVYLTAYGPNRLFKNRGDGTFYDVSKTASVDDDRYGTGCSFGDYDGDGLVDLYVANYVRFDLDRAREKSGTHCQFMGVPVMCGPRHFDGERDVFFRNNGDGTFADATTEAGIDDPGYRGFGVLSSDLDADGWLDIYVANDTEPNFFFKNDGDGTFSEIALGVGLALNEEGRPEAGMGVDAGDYDHDGWLDVVVTNFSDETNTLYRGSASGFFTDVTHPAGLAGSTMRNLGWGTGFVDLNNDGWLDLFVANGHVYPEVDESPLGTTFAQKRQLFENVEGRFREATPEVGEALSRETSSRGTAFGDFDDDGDVDVLVVNLDETPSLLRNDGGNQNSWLRLRLIGTNGNRDAVGARVEVASSGLSHLAEVRSGGSYLSHNDPRLHFGMGTADTVPSVTIRWPGGATETLKELPVNTTLTVVEGRGVVHRSASRRRSASARLSGSAAPRLARKRR